MPEQPHPQSEAKILTEAEAVEFDQAVEARELLTIFIKAHAAYRAAEAAVQVLRAGKADQAETDFKTLIEDKRTLTAQLDGLARQISEAYRDIFALVGDTKIIFDAFAGLEGPHANDKILKKSLAYWHGKQRGPAPQPESYLLRDLEEIFVPTFAIPNGKTGKDDRFGKLEIDTFFTGADIIAARGAVERAASAVESLVRLIVERRAAKTLREQEAREWAERITRAKANEVAREALERFEKGELNLERARELGLEVVALPGFPEADRLIARILPNQRMAEGQGPNSEFIDINTPAGQEQFCRDWRAKNGDLPPPCIPPEALFAELYPGKEFPTGVDEATGNFWYLQKLAAGKIVKNLSGKATLALPEFGAPEAVLAEQWTEEDWDATDGEKRKLQSTAWNSPLLKALGIEQTGVVNIKRETIDAALWQGDPGTRAPSKRHTEVLKQLGLADADFEIHCIRQDQYVRGAEAKGWGEKNLWTHFDDFFLGDDGGQNGLLGGHRKRGGASDVDYSWRGIPDEYDAVRLVLSPRRNR